MKPRHQNLTMFKADPSTLRQKELTEVLPSFPKPLISMMNDYLAPTQETIDEVNQDLFKLGYHTVDWTGIPVRIGSLSSPCDLSKLNLDGIIFHPEETVKRAERKDELKSQPKLVAWIQRFAPHMPKTFNPKLVSINFGNASLENATLENLVCAGFDFEDACLKNTSFKWSILTGAHFNKANMRDANLSYCYGSSFQCGSIYYTNFHLTDLKRADLSQSIFKYAKFTGCSLKHAILKRADFTGTTFSSVVMGWANTKHINNLSDSDASGAIFEGVNFTDAILDGVNFTEANLTDATFIGASLKQAKLKGAKFSLSRLTKPQVLSLDYRHDKHACRYIEAIYKYMEENDKTKHKKGFERAEALILSFIHGVFYANGENLELLDFLRLGKLRNAPFWERASSQTDENALCARLWKVRKKIQLEKTSPAADASHSPKMCSIG